jgi:hypothetical protein
MTAMPKAIENWHHYMKAQGPAALDLLLSDDVVFESPVVHTPQVGKAITTAYLTAAAHVLGNDQFRYLNEWYGEQSAVLEFSTVLDGITVNGIDMIFWDEHNRINRFKVMVRPLKAVNQIHQMMGQALSAAKG